MLFLWQAGRASAYIFKHEFGDFLYPLEIRKNNYLLVSNSIREEKRNGKRKKSEVLLTHRLEDEKFAELKKGLCVDFALLNLMQRKTWRRMKMSPKESSTSPLLLSPEEMFYFRTFLSVPRSRLFSLLFVRIQLSQKLMSGRWSGDPASDTSKTPKEQDLRDFSVVFAEVQPGRNKSARNSRPEM